MADWAQRMDRPGVRRVPEGRPGVRRVPEGRPGVRRVPEGRPGVRRVPEDRPGVRQVPEGSGEQGKMEKTGCEFICGAPTTLAVKG